MNGKLIEFDNYRKPDEIKAMYLGGNRNFRKFLNSMGITINMNKEDVFMSNCVNYYRKKLKAEVEDDDDFDEDPPEKEERFIRSSEVKKKETIPTFEEEENEDEEEYNSKLFNQNEYNKYSQKYSRRSKFMELIKQCDTKSELAKTIVVPKKEHKSVLDDTTNTNNTYYSTFTNMLSTVWSYGSSALGSGYNYIASYIPSNNNKAVQEENNYSENLINDNSIN